jgi:hypothetical protein
MRVVPNLLFYFSNGASYLNNLYHYTHLSFLFPHLFPIFIQNLYKAKSALGPLYKAPFLKK